MPPINSGPVEPNGFPSQPNGFPSQPNGFPSQPIHRKSSSLTLAEQKEQYAQAAITFDKTIRGHYRHGKAGYARVGVLFLTWEADDMQCKATEVDSLRALFANDFQFETDLFQIPSKQCSTALMAKLAAFCLKYDSPDCLTIVYYGGHGYSGEETGLFKLAAKSSPDENGDPRVFFNEIEACLRAPECDQLVIIDCCYSAKAFAREHIGKRKFELITSAAHNVQSDAPRLPESFTQTLNQVLRGLLKRYPQGFCTSQLYREIYHQIPEKKPLLFDQSRWSYGRIWLRPQRPIPQIEYDEEERTHLNLTLKLNKQPEGAIMNELASHLQFLPHVDQVRIEQMWAPRRRITDFMRFVMRVQKLRPFVRKIYESRQQKKRRHVDDKDVPVPVKRLQMQSAQKHETLYDWSSAREGPAHIRRKSSTWPAGPVNPVNEVGENALVG